MKFPSIVSLTLLGLTVTNAFTTIRTPSMAKYPQSSPSALFVESETFFRAVECAEGKVSCDLKELDTLATELEEFVGCNYEKDSSEETCEKEVQDRMDLAEILRLRIELQLRLDYLKSGNLFAEDVKKEHDMEERKQFKESLIANREKAAGSDLGLW
mmetsp:Transcript_22107/g.29082  ORF Transcript_22107/g.29082 Transcript_22107/m.29082 type:complete len:157 (-) Transcript_22107:314-784(-)